MSKANFWAVPSRDGKGWAVCREGADRVLSVHATQAEAWAEAQQLARNSKGEAVLLGTDGMIRERNTYGSDPFPPKG